MITKKAVIFDLDGTLLDTIEDLTFKINLMHDHFGHRELTKEEVIKCIGSGVVKLVADSIGEPLSDKDFNERLNYFKSLYAGDANRLTRVFDGVDKVLKDLSADGYILAIVTNKPESATKLVVSEFLSEYNFVKIISDTGNGKCKPDKEPTLNMLKEIGVEPKNAYFVGDGETDVLTAKNTGTNGISVLWGYRTKEQLLAAGAKVFAETPSRLYEIIKNGN